MIRTVNRKLIFSLIRYKGLTYKTLGERMNPAISKTALSRLFSEKDTFKPEKRIREVGDILGVPSEVLFPYQNE